jgi:hypothetical protein
MYYCTKKHNNIFRVRRYSVIYVQCDPKIFTITSCLRVNFDSGVAMQNIIGL